MKQLDILEKITQFADQAHGEQRRKYTPEKYIVHPIRVMEICSIYIQSLPVLGAALLHDVIEDTPLSKYDIATFLTDIMSPSDVEVTVRIVVELTDVYTKESYPKWNRTIRKIRESERLQSISPDAQTVKYADILDNCSEILQYDRGFGKRFLTECKVILDLAQKGDPVLHRRTQTLVDAGLKTFINPKVK